MPDPEASSNRINTGHLMDAGMAGKGKVEDDLDSFSTVFQDLPTINAQLIFFN